MHHTFARFSDLSASARLCSWRTLCCLLPEKKHRGVRPEFVDICQRFFILAFFRTAFLSRFSSTLFTPRTHATSTLLVTDDPSIPNASANSRLLIPRSLPKMITASLTATVTRFLLLLHSSCRLNPLALAASFSRSSMLVLSIVFGATL